ncbi:MAG: alpha/beta hydrolase fold domain-containing protein [Planctomycetota bacterium]
MNRLVTLALVTVMFALALPASLSPQCLAQDVQPDELRIYKSVDDVELNLHMFYPEGHEATDQRPAIVFFFGGGWNGGTPTQFYKQSRFLSERGMVACCAEYRVRSRNGTSPRECVMDGKSAIRWLRTNATELGIHPDKISAGGGSAGGHVAAATATTSGFDEEGEDTSISCVPAALVLFNPVYDNGPEGYGHDRVKEYWQQISPMHNISASTPPTIVFLGTNDGLVPVETAERYKELMEAAGCRCDLHLYQDQGHGFFNRGEPYELTLQETDRFLTSLGYLAEPATDESDREEFDEDRNERALNEEEGLGRQPEGSGGVRSNDR